MIGVALLLLMGCFMASAQNEKVKAIFLYNFIKNVEWPQAGNQGELVIGVVGSNAMKAELESITSSRAGSQSIKVKVFSSMDEVTNCQMVYVAPNKTSQIAQLSSKLGNQSTLIVSDGRGGINQGAGINFTIADDKLKFEISKQRIEQNGMKVSSTLVKMGIEVI